MYQSSEGAHVFDIQIDAGKALSHGAEPEGSILFPNRDMLFTASFRRSGVDLLLLTPERTAIIWGYFSDERRSDITTREGARLKGATIEALAGPDPPERYAQATGSASVQTPIGRVEKVSGSVTVLRNGILIELRLGDTVAKGDVVQTGPDSFLTIKLNDGTVFNLSSSARMVLNDMVYTADSSANTAFFSLIQGLIGFVAGQVAKTGDLRVDTPVATMAIRGTAVQTEIVAVSGVTRFSLLTEPDGRVGSITLLDKADPSRVIASISDARVATLLTPVAGGEPQITKIAKTNDDIQRESDLVRDLFQFVSSEPRQRRGSSDPEDAPIIPARLPQSIDALNESKFTFVPFAQERAASGDLRLPVLMLAPAAIEGTAIEDGPLERLNALPDTAARDAGTQPLVLVPSTLPPGVRYLSDTRSFALDPTHSSYQRLRLGEKKVVTVEYSLVDNDGTVVPAVVTWIVDGRNDAPTARSDRIAAVKESGGTILDVLQNDRDIDGDTLRVVNWTSPSEGSVSLDARGNLVFDPGDDFRALSRGETASVSFSYTVSDENGGRDAAMVILKVNGEGTFSSPHQSVSEADILDFNNQSVSLTIEAPTATTTARADLEIVITRGPVLQPQMNILYLIDVSGSTSDTFEGASVGDLNGDGRANTILDAEIASLVSLTEKVRELGFSPADVTVTVIPFNESADPTDARNPDLDGLNAVTFSLDQAEDGGVDSYLRSLAGGGETNFADALRAANSRLQSLDQGNETNVLYFLSDGRGQGALDGEVAALNDRYNTRIAAYGVGEDASLSQLNRLDNTGGASLLISPEQIDSSILEAPLPSGQVADVDVFVNGRQVVGVGPEDLVLTGDRLVLNTSIDGLRPLAGDESEASVIVTFESGEVLAAKLNIAGALPRSTDFVL